MKKSIQIIATVLVILLGNVGFSQNDTMYFMKDGLVVHKQPVSSSDVDSAIFYYPFKLATLTTTAVVSITETSAVSGGNITNNGGAAVTSRGICWGTSPNPTPADNSSINGSGIGSFESNLSGLIGGTTYYVRAYAINSEGTAYGNEVSFTTTTPIQLATLSTTSISSITETSAVSGGNITNNGGAAVTSRGICWGTSPNPTPADNSSINGSGTGSFASNLIGLTDGTTYYVRAYAINSAGTAYGNEVSFTTISISGVVYGDGVTDANGNTYQSVIIGNQEWMAENLRTTKYNDGIDIPNGINANEWNVDSGVWCNYNNNTQYDTAHGKIYNWYAVETDKLCPTGWHVPTEAEFINLRQYLTNNGFTGLEGDALKTTANSDHIQGSLGVRSGTDNYGWRATLSGYRNGTDYIYDDEDNEAGEGWGFYGDSQYGLSNCYWWSSTEFNSENSVTLSLGFDLQSYGMYFPNNYKRNGHYVRCLKD